MLIRLVVLGGRIIALTGRGGMPEGDPGGELAIALIESFVATKWDDGEKEIVGSGDTYDALVRRGEERLQSVLSYVVVMWLFGFVICSVP